jgi:hypothetical protein
VLLRTPTPMPRLKHVNLTRLIGNNSAPTSSQSHNPSAALITLRHAKERRIAVKAERNYVAENRTRINEKVRACVNY